MISETYQGPEVAPRVRLPYGAVPLAPWQAVHPETGALYYNSSLNRIADLTDEAIQIAMEDGRLQDPTISHSVHELLQGSLMDAHTRRILHNSHANLDEIAKVANPVMFEAALQGVARPDELYDLLRQHPEMGSIELAKLTHPFNFAGSEQMDQVVRGMLSPRAELVDEAPRYKVKRVDPTLPAAILVRKRVIAAELLNDGFIEVIERRSLLVRGDAEAIEEVPYVDRMVKNPARRDELTERIEAELKSDDTSIAWLQPTTTSYYACFHKVD